MTILILLTILFLICVMYRVNTYYEGFAYHFCGFIEIVCVIVAMFTIMSLSYKQNIMMYGNYKYEIDIPQGKYIHSYYTNEYSIKDNGSISFKDSRGSFRASPTYSIETNHYYLEKRGLD